MENWEKFQPASVLKVARRRQRRIRLFLVVATASFFALLIGRVLRPHVVDALTYAKAIVRLPREELPLAPASNSDKPTVRAHRKQRNLAPALRFSRKRELGPFDAYILSGDRYIRLDGMSKYALLDTRTGQVIWVKEPE